MHGKMASKRGMELTGSTANELNSEELARLQSGNYANLPGSAAVSRPDAVSYRDPNERSIHSFRDTIHRRPNPPAGLHPKHWSRRRSAQTGSSRFLIEG
jgi:hypothetical protein